MVVEGVAVVTARMPTAVVFHHSSCGITYGDGHPEPIGFQEPFLPDQGSDHADGLPFTRSECGVCERFGRSAVRCCHAS